MLFFQKKFEYSSLFHRVKVEAVLVSGQKIQTGLKIVSEKLLRQLKRDLKMDFDQVETIRISGKLLVENPGHYGWGISYPVPAGFLINGRTVIQPDSTNQVGRLYLSRGMHDFQLHIRPDRGRADFRMKWRNPGEKTFKMVSPYTFYGDSADRYSIGQLIKFRQKARISGTIYAILVYLFLALFLACGFTYIDRSATGFDRGPSPSDVRIGQSGPVVKSGFRQVEIDVTKGFAAFLMIAAHAPGGNAVLPFGNFGAALFFFCSGMNTIIFLDRTRHLKGINWYQFFFALLLFFGGYTQIVIAHQKTGKLIPEFLQFNALGILLIFFLFRIFKDQRWVGYLFFLPFLIHLGFKYQLLPSLPLYHSVLDYFVGKHIFPLFPWSGFLLFGVFMFSLREKPKIRRWIMVMTGLAAMAAVQVFRIPISRYDMSVSYICLSLFALTFVFSGFIRMENVRSGTYRIVRTNLALLGRNSLMFIYVHYAVLHFFLPRVPDQYRVMELVIHSLVAFTLCTFFILIYEKVKHEHSLLIPVLIFTFTLFSLRHALHYEDFGNLILIDMVVGILFAFLYVQLRGKFRLFLKKV